MPDMSRQDRESLLERLYNAQLRAVVEIMERTPPLELKAATITACRQFLADQGINADALRSKGRGLLGGLASELPTFPDEQAPAVPPFTPLTATDASDVR